MVFHWVNVTLRVMIVRGIMVLYAKPIGFLVMIPIGLIIGTVGQFGMV
jgi:hypothetical protein